MFAKNMPMVLLLPLLPLHIALNALLLLRAAFLGEAGAMLRGLRDAAFGMNKVLARRRIIQERRTASIADLAARMDWSVAGVLGRRSKTRPATSSAAFSAAHPSPTS
jgi:hypothetical protein